MAQFLGILCLLGGGLVVWGLISDGNRLSTRLGSRPRWPVAGPVALTLGVALLFFWGWERPILGLLGLVLVPAVRLLWARHVRERDRRLCEEEFSHLLSALLGLLQSGLSFSASVERLATRSSFAKTLARSWRRFESGNHLSESLSRFGASRALGPRVRLWWEILGGLHSQGYGLVPALSRLSPFWRRRLRLEHKQRELLQSAYVQGLFAMVLPWGLLGWMLFWGEGTSVLIFSDPIFWVTATVVFVCEGVGFVCLRKVARF